MGYSTIPKRINWIHTGIKEAKILLNSRRLKILIEHFKQNNVILEIGHSGGSNSTAHMFHNIFVISQCIFNAREWLVSFGGPPSLWYPDSHSLNANLLQRCIEWIHHGIQQIEVLQISIYHDRACGCEQCVTQWYLLWVWCVSEIWVHIHQYWCTWRF